MKKKGRLNSEKYLKRKKQRDRKTTTRSITRYERICKYRRVAQRVTAILIQRAISIDRSLPAGTESDETKVEGGSGWYFLSMQNSAEGRSN